MIAIIATLTADPAKATELEAAFVELTATVKANEPGCRLYQLTRSRDGEAVYKVMELYDGEAEMKAHGRSDHFRSAWPGIAALLSAPAKVEVLDVP